MFETQRDFE